MNNASDFGQFGQLRAQIEAAFSEPAIIVITSATAGDGTTTTAFGLALALAEADTRVLFVDANVKDPTLAGPYLVPMTCRLSEMSEIARFVKPLPERKFYGLSFCDEGFERSMSMEKARAAAQSMRSAFDFIVVDTAPLVRSDLAVLFAAVADATIVTVRLGRFPSSADGEMMSTLSRIDVNTMGVLTVEAALMKSFAAERASLMEKSALLPTRGASGRPTRKAESVKEIVDQSPSNAL